MNRLQPLPRNGDAWLKRVSSEIRSASDSISSSLRRDSQTCLLAGTSLTSDEAVKMEQAGEGFTS
ncbi:hypothetical protein M514_06308 [Trichuris suis]|uniref:Uncharacterized protein n=1 Tax=Trichuris suis TaxID=68888 RepID=A0A085M6H1_9BILA|nr:hypothetical protein M513_06308 [Trichuris suis]KFD64940.1 hypothetical protein M514_06308 [Trichuris suis]